MHPCTSPELSPSPKWNAVAAHPAHELEWAQPFERKREFEQKLDERACVVVRGTTHGKKLVERHVPLVILTALTFSSDNQRGSLINIEALCAAPPKALAHSPSQLPLSCPVAPPSQRELHKDRAAAVVVTSLARGGEGGGRVMKSFEPTPQVSK